MYLIKSNKNKPIILVMVIVLLLFIPLFTVIIYINVAIKFIGWANIILIPFIMCIMGAILNIKDEIQKYKTMK